jgi:hypothetical protein
MVVLAAALVLVVAAGVLVAVRLLGEDDGAERSRRARAADATFADAVALAPSDARRLLWTDWGGVRDELGLDLDADSTPDQVEQLLDRGFDADLTSTTALVDSAPQMQERLGFSPATLEWELFTQSEKAATLTMRLGAGVTTDEVATALRAAGYVEPSRPDGTWTSDDDDPIAGQVTPELAFIALDDDAGIVYAADRAAGVTIAVAAADDSGSSTGSVPAGVVAGLGSPLSAAAYDGDQACSALAMANADPSEQTEGETLVAEAGKVNPVTGFGIGSQPGGGVRVTLGFDNAEQARTNADTRAKLAAGPAPGQGGDFSDRFGVEKVTADGTVVTFDLAPVDGAFVVSDLSTGPVLFATC